MNPIDKTRKPGTRAALLLFLVLAVGCRREFADRNLKQLKANMSQKEVESILGTPDKTEKSETETEKTVSFSRYYYMQDGRTIELQFRNGRLVNPPEHVKEN
ncbi:MAG: hypothetical protein JOY96_12060 [Verrucomicrobia bacterium]|nr:hypothetical protein [Verrucomicrobiota bacterium]MBV9672282.1 hypothetical protein [Verrucomicrobiota bacterium]